MDKWILRYTRSVVLSLTLPMLIGVLAAASPPPGLNSASGQFAPQARLGFTSGDQWEPAIAADPLGHVYILYAQYLGVPGCPECDSPTAILQISQDNGATW